MKLASAYVNTVIRDATDTLHQLSGGELDLRFYLSSELPAVEIDVKQLERVLRHLVADARDALPSGGRLTIATRLALRSDGHDVVLTITDSRSRAVEDPTTSIFEPTIAAKKAARGAGLNRAAVYGIVLQMGGQITVDNPPGGGLTFAIRLPVNDG